MCMCCVCVYVCDSVYGTTRLVNSIVIMSHDQADVQTADSPHNVRSTMKKVDMKSMIFNEVSSLIMKYQMSPPTYRS